MCFVNTQAIFLQLQMGDLCIGDFVAFFTIQRPARRSNGDD
jgi:hypothetical protein